MKYKILIVEDSKVDQEIYKKLLDKQKFSLTILDKVIDVVKTVEENQPDIVLMDVIMPDGDGIDVCLELKSNKLTSEIPVIVVTSSDYADTLGRAYKSGIVDYIRKPFNNMELLIRIENVLRMREQQKELIRLHQDNTVSEMGRAIAHNFNQPLAAILGVVQLLQMYKKNTEELKNPELNELFGMIIEASEQLSGLVDKVEGLAKYKTKKYCNTINIIDFD